MILLIIAIAALIRTNLYQSKKIKDFSLSNSDYNKIFEENIELHTALLQLEIENNILKKKKNELLVSMIELQNLKQEKLKVIYSIN